MIIKISQATLRIWNNKKNLGFKDGAIVPEHVERSGSSTLVRGSYPHEDAGHSQQVPCGLARGWTTS